MTRPCAHRWSVVFPRIGGRIVPELMCGRDREGCPRVPIAAAWEDLDALRSYTALVWGEGEADALHDAITEAWRQWSASLAPRG